MTIDSLPLGFSFSPEGKRPDVHTAAREFEALMISSLLKTAREAGDVLGDPEKETGVEGYLELAEEHLARTMAHRDCFGIARMVLEKVDGSETLR